MARSTLLTVSRKWWTPFAAILSAIVPSRRCDMIPLLTYAAMAKMVDHMEKLIRGEAPQPAAATLINMRLDSFAPGEATVVLDADARHANPMGTVQGGILAAMT